MSGEKSRGYEPYQLGTCLRWGTVPNTSEPILGRAVGTESWLLGVFHRGLT